MTLLSYILEANHGLDSLHARDMLLSENPDPINRRNTLSPQARDNGVEGSRPAFADLCSLQSLSNIGDDHLELERTGTKKKCYDCQRGTHWRFWLSPSFALRLCQACAKRRGGKYARLILNAIDYGDR